MNLAVQYGDRKIPYHVTVNEALIAKVRIHVHPDERVEVSAPQNFTPDDVSAAVQKRARWVITQMDAARDRRAQVLPREYISGETHFYGGRRYLLKVILEPALLSPQVKMRGGRIQVRTSSTDPDSVHAALDAWYSAKAKALFARRLQRIVAEVSWLETVPDFKLGIMQKQWGSCSPQGELHLNTWLSRAPMDCIDYVITHELCHLRERHHGKAFYRLLSRHCPDWQDTKKKLDDLAELLLAE